MSLSFDPDALRDLLPPLEQAVELPAMQAYRQFYGLEFAGVQQVRLGHVEAAGYRLAVQCWQPAAATASLLLLHGYYDHMGLYRHIIDWALRQGFAVLACDLPGHGLSTGERASISDFAEYQAALQALFAQAERMALPKPWHVLGQSTGGAILLDYLLTGEPRPELGQSILLAPLVRPRAWNWSRLSYRLLAPFVDAVPRRYTVNSSDSAFIDFVHNQDPLQPQVLPVAWVAALERWIARIEQLAQPAPGGLRPPLIVQGGLDRTVDWRHNLAVLQRQFQGAEVLLLEQASHHLANEQAALREQYLGFLSRRLQAPGWPALG